jgi:hypothetical protein
MYDIISLRINVYKLKRKEIVNTIRKKFGRKKEYHG